MEKKHTIGENALVCQEAFLKGTCDITIGNGCILHPNCTVDAVTGPIIIDADCIIEECVTITNSTTATLIIGPRNVFEVGCEVRNPKAIGASNIFETKSVVSEGCTIKDGCTIGIKAVVYPQEVIDNETVIFGPKCLRHSEKDSKKLHDIQLARHLEILRETLPKSHYMKNQAASSANLGGGSSGGGEKTKEVSIPKAAGNIQPRRREGISRTCKTKRLADQVEIINQNTRVKSYPLY
eukprot:Filipodium_phascolosomae@DN1367_c0_g1_i1.p1